MRQYHDLLRRILDTGVEKPTRAKLESTGENISAISRFGDQIRFDLREGFPLVTTKRVAFRWVFEELAWFLRGETNVRSLQEKGVTIWDAWQDPDGNLGPVYGWSWRHWGAEWRPDPVPADCGYDQIREVVKDTLEVVADPTASAGRRLLVTAWDPRTRLPKAPPACHTLWHLNVTGGRLNCQLYQRSCDVFLGACFNIASYALLTHFLAKVTGLEPGEFIHTFGDVHIYTNHLDQVREQLSREPMPLPQLIVADSVRTLDDLAKLTYDQVMLINYRSWPALKGEVAV